MIACEGIVCSIADFLRSSKRIFLQPGSTGYEGKRPTFRVRDVSSSRRRAQGCRQDIVKVAGDFELTLAPSLSRNLTTAIHYDHPPKSVIGASDERAANIVRELAE